jgi:cellulose biosynthesis protein BcsQ
MLAYSTYSEAGGVGKTTTAVNLAVAHARAGLDPLVVPLDPQDGDLSRLLGVDDDRTEPVDNLVRHMVGHPKGDFDGLVRTVEGVDVVFEHNMLSNLSEHLQQANERTTDGSFDPHAQLLRVLRENDVPDSYDVLVCDPPATEGDHLYNAIHATRSLVIPFEPSAKGLAAVRGLESMITGLQEHLDVEVGVLAVVPSGFKDTRDQRNILDEIEYPIPEVVGERTSLMEGSWMEQCSAFEYVRTHRDRNRPYEIETLAKFDRIARHLEKAVGIEAPAPPEPGDVTHEVIPA